MRRTFMMGAGAALLALYCTVQGSEAATVISEELTGDVLPASLEVWQGAPSPTREGLRSRAGDDCVVVAAGLPELSSFVASVTTRPLQRSSQGGWAVAGVSVYRDAGSNWVLHLVEGPDGNRYAELLERYDGTHQAQAQGTTKLETLASEDKGAWTPGCDYRMELGLSADAVEGTVTRIDTGEVLYHRGFSVPAGTLAVRSGLPALVWTGLDTAFRSLTVTAEQGAAPAVRIGFGQRRAVGVVDQPQAPESYVGSLLRLLTEKGYEVRRISGADALAGSDAGIVVLPWAPGFPIDATDALMSYLRRDGYLLALGGTLSTEAFRAAEADLAEREAKLASTPPSGRFLDPIALGPEGFSRCPSPNEGDGRLEVSPGTQGGDPPAVDIRFDAFRDWETYAAQVAPLPESDMMTLLTVKGDGTADYLVAEWQEVDGSRWIATVPLTTQWRTLALLPRHFTYWPDNPSEGRGGPGDQVHLDRVKLFSLGLAHMGGTRIRPGRHRFWVSGFGYAPTPPGLAPVTWQPPTIETLSPDYKTYTLDSVSQFTVPAARQGLFPLPDGLPSMAVVSPIARSHAEGYSENQPYRWIPLVEGTGRGGGEATLAGLFIPRMGPLSGARWATIGASREALASSPDALARLSTAVIGALTRPTLLECAGLNQAACTVEEGGTLAGFDAEPVVGAAVANEGEALTATVRTSWYREGGQAPELVMEPKAADVARGGRDRVVLPLVGARFAPGNWVVQTELACDGEVVDRIRQSVSLVAPPSGTREDMVQVHDGHFWLKGSRWHAHGINFWPRYASGTEAEEYVRHWLTPEAYIPEEVEEDLRIAEGLGINTVSIIYGNARQAAPLNDFMARCAAHGMLVYAYVGGWHPLNDAAAGSVELIKLARLRANPTLFAYDLAWEPHWGGFPQRAAHRATWERWVLAQYGSIEDAERDWGFAIPRNEAGQVEVPSDRQIRSDGDWTKMACAYSRFLDDYIGARWLRETRTVRGKDPDHLLSYRAAGQPGWSAWGAYDMVAAGAFVDFLGPEGYGQDPAEAGFTTAYARWAGNGKPVWWAEFGSSIGRCPTGESMEAQTRLWQGFLKMAVDSEADGTAGWWFPGGYRVNERSDFGVISPEGVPRPAAVALRELSQSGRLPPPRRTERVTVRIDRDLHAANYQAIYEEHKHHWVEANAAGKGLDIATEATGTTSATVALTAIGNVAASGSNPPKYLNALFSRVQMRCGADDWVTVEDGDEVAVPAGVPVDVRAEVVNVSEPTWLAGDADGGVELAAGQRGGLRFSAPLSAPVGRFETAGIGPSRLTDGVTQRADVTFAMHCRARCWFGERMNVRLLPRQ